MEIIGNRARWVDILKPTEKDLMWLKKTYRLHPIIVQELQSPSIRGKIESHGTYLYLIYYFPVYDPEERVSRRSEIDFIITKRDVITVRYEKVEVFDDLRKTLSPKSHVLNDTLQLTHKLIESLLSFQQRQLHHIREKLEGVSAELFRDRESEREKTLLEKISYLKRDISEYRIIVRPQKHILESFFNVGCNFLGSNCSVYFNDLIGEHMKIIDQLEDYREAVEDYGTTNNQLIHLKNAQVVKTFTILAFLTFPMMLFAALFSMNTKDTPIVELPYGFWIVLGIMLVAMIGMYRYFRKRDWI